MLTSVTDQLDLVIRNQNEINRRVDELREGGIATDPNEDLAREARCTLGLDLNMSLVSSCYNL